MATEEKNSKPSKTQIIWRLLFPFAAMRQTITLVKQELDRTKQNSIAVIDLGKKAHKTLTDDIKEKKTMRNDTSETVMRYRSDNEQNYRFFLLRKRIVIGTALLFALPGLYTLFGGIWYEHSLGIVLGIISLLASQPLCFMLALSAQLRLWQLRTHRLSKEEKGGLEDFMREVKGWWWVVLNPEIGYAANNKRR